MLWKKKIVFKKNLHVHYEHVRLALIKALDCVGDNLAEYQWIIILYDMI